MTKGGIISKTAAVMLAAVVFFSCAREITITESVHFAFLANTYPVSPFSGFTKSLPTVVAEIKNHKPFFIIHGGNAIYGGSEEYGIKERDLRRQLKIFFSYMEDFTSPFYVITGERDLYNGSSKLMSEYSGKSSYFSFNYGSIHFVCLGVADTGEDFISDREIHWLKKELAQSTKYSSIFVITSKPFLNYRNSKSLPVPEELHKVFLDNNVRFVFSSGKENFEKQIDMVHYISLSCGGYNDEKENRKTEQYYIIDYFNNEVNIKAYRVNISK